MNSPLYPLLNEINKAASSGLPMIAVSMTVALPDICSSLASEDGRTNSQRYKDWCSENFSKERFSFVTPDDLYSMRCGVLHNGRFGDIQHSVGRVIFSLPGSPAFVDCRINDAYFYSVVDFCGGFTEAVYSWLEANNTDPVIKVNMPRLMQYREGGIALYVVGAML